MWVAITLDNVAEVHLARGNGDAAVRYLYATLNHATPLYTWCEERGQEPGTAKCSGDRQHLWTPVAVVRAIRDSMVMEDGDGLQLALGPHASWLASGQPVGGIAGASTQSWPGFLPDEYAVATLDRDRQGYIRPGFDRSLGLASPSPARRTEG